MSGYSTAMRLATPTVPFYWGPGQERLLILFRVHRQDGGHGKQEQRPVYAKQ